MFTKPMARIPVDRYHTTTQGRPRCLTVPAGNATSVEDWISTVSKELESIRPARSFPLSGEPKHMLPLRSEAAVFTTNFVASLDGDDPNKVAAMIKEDAITFEFFDGDIKLGKVRMPPNVSHCQGVGSMEHSHALDVISDFLSAYGHLLVRLVYTCRMHTPGSIAFIKSFLTDLKRGASITYASGYQRHGVLDLLLKGEESGVKPSISTSETHRSREMVAFQRQVVLAKEQLAEPSTDLAVKIAGLTLGDGVETVPGGALTVPGGVLKGYHTHPFRKVVNLKQAAFQCHYPNVTEELYDKIITLRPGKVHGGKEDDVHYLSHSHMVRKLFRARVLVRIVRPGTASSPLAHENVLYIPRVNSMSVEQMRNASYPLPLEFFDAEVVYSENGMKVTDHNRRPWTLDWERIRVVVIQRPYKNDTKPEGPANQRNSKKRASQSDGGSIGESADPQQLLHIIVVLFKYKNGEDDGESPLWGAPEKPAEQVGNGGNVCVCGVGGCPEEQGSMPPDMGKVDPNAPDISVPLAQDVLSKANAAVHRIASLGRVVCLCLSHHVVKHVIVQARAVRGSLPEENTKEIDFYNRLIAFLESMPQGKLLNLTHFGTHAFRLNMGEDPEELYEANKHFGTNYLTNVQYRLMPFNEWELKPLFEREDLERVRNKTIGESFFVATRAAGDRNGVQMWTSRKEQQKCKNQLHPEVVSAYTLMDEFVTQRRFVAMLPESERERYEESTPRQEETADDGPLPGAWPAMAEPVRATTEELHGTVDALATGAAGTRVDESKSDEETPDLKKRKVNPGPPAHVDVDVDDDDDDDEDEDDDKDKDMDDDNDAGPLLGGENGASVRLMVGRAMGSALQMVLLAANKMQAAADAVLSTNPKEYVSVTGPNPETASCGCARTTVAEVIHLCFFVMAAGAMRFLDSGLISRQKKADRMRPLDPEATFGMMGLPVNVRAFASPNPEFDLVPLVMRGEGERLRVCRVARKHDWKRVLEGGGPVDDVWVDNLRANYDPHDSAQRKDFEHLLFGAILLNVTGLINRFELWRMYESKVAGDPKGERKCLFPGANKEEVLRFLDFMQCTIGDPTSSLTDWLSRQFLNSIPKELRETFTNFKSFVLAVFDSKSDIHDKLILETRGLGKEKRREQCVERLALALSRCVPSQDVSTQNRDKMRFLACKIITSLETVYHGESVFGLETPDSVIPGSGGVNGMKLIHGNVEALRKPVTSDEFKDLYRQTMEEFRTTLECLCSTSPERMRAMGIIRTKSGRLVSLLTGAPFSYAMFEHFLCKAAVVYSSTHPSRNGSSRPFVDRPYAFPYRRPEGIKLPKPYDGVLVKFLLEAILDGFMKCIDSDKPLVFYPYTYRFRGELEPGWGDEDEDDASED